jgi:hypothetical protein
MIGLPDDNSKFDNPYSNDSSSTPLLPASQGRGSLDNPPPFQSNGSTSSNNIIDFIQEDTWAQYGGEAPPEFTPYEAQHWVNADGNIVSHDPHLNEDGSYFENVPVMPSNHLALSQERRSIASCYPTRLSLHDSAYGFEAHIGKQKPAW